MQFIQVGTRILGDHRCLASATFSKGFLDGLSFPDVTRPTSVAIRAEKFDDQATKRQVDDLPVVLDEHG